MLKRVRFLSAILILALVLAPAGALAASQKLLILSFNDLHGQLLPYESDAGGQKRSLGGAARLAGAIKAQKKELGIPSLVVDSGDDLTGRFMIHFHGQAIYSVLAASGVEVSTLGNHEFDLGPKVLAQALSLRSYPLVVSNLTPTPDGPLAGKWHSTLVLERGGLKIGILGLITPDLMQISNTGGAVTFKAGVHASARKAVKELRARKVDLVVALSHLGLEPDQELAANVSGIDVISGGHSHSLTPTGGELLIQAPNGRKTIITQCGSRGAYLGRLVLEVSDGRVVSHSWRAILIDAALPADPGVAKLVASYRAKLPGAVRLAQCSVPLDCRRATVRFREAVVGNLVADIMRSQFKTQVALVNGGGLRGERIISPGWLTSSDVETLLPFGNQIDVMKVKGSTLLEALNWGLSGMSEGAGRFLQVSGIRFAAKGGKVAWARVLGPDGSYAPLDPKAVYTLATNSYMAGGGDGFVMFKNQALSRRHTFVTLAELVGFKLKEMKKVDPKLEGRIKLEP